MFSLLKGFDYEEALILAGVLALLLANRPAFYRKASLLSHPLSPAWFATIAAIIAGSVWLGLFAYKHVEYTNALWWDFAYRGDAPRFLRASLTVVVLAVGFLLYTLLRPARPKENKDQLEPETLRGIIAGSERADANLALSGDKRFLVSDDEDAFIMFQVQGRSWVALGDPVGDVDAWGPLLWRFRELCDPSRRLAGVLPGFRRKSPALPRSGAVAVQVRRAGAGRSRYLLPGRTRPQGFALCRAARSQGRGGIRGGAGRAGAGDLRGTAGGFRRVAADQGDPGKRVFRRLVQRGLHPQFRLRRGAPQRRDRRLCQRLAGGLPAARSRSISCGTPRARPTASWTSCSYG